MLNFSEKLEAWDYEMTVEVEQPEHITSVSRLLLDRFGESLLSVKTVQVFRKLKFAGFPRGPTG